MMIDYVARRSRHARPSVYLVYALIRPERF